MAFLSTKPENGHGKDDHNQKGIRYQPADVEPGRPFNQIGYRLLLISVTSIFYIVGLFFSESLVVEFLYPEASYSSSRNTLSP
jgi:hypothetical protein